MEKISLTNDKQGIIQIIDTSEDFQSLSKDEKEFILKMFMENLQYKK
jgi:hypothetical protein